MAIIEVEDLVKKYNRIVAIKGISFRVEKGEILGFLGPNAAGKTTTMRILTCFLPPTSGKVKIAGFDIFVSSLEIRRLIGYLPENVSFYPEMRVRNYLDFVAKLRGVKKRKSKIEEVMHCCWLTNVADTIIHRLSKGYKQRLGLAQALIHEPEILILDEPTEGLDPKQIVETRELIKSLAGEHTIILCSHILPEVNMICKQIAIINEGEIIVMDSVENLHKKLQEVEKIYLHVKEAPAEEIITKLKEIVGVIEVNIEKENIFIIDCEKGSDLRSEIAACVINNGWKLVEIQSIGMNLEEIFLKITTEEILVKKLLEEK